MSNAGNIAKGSPSGYAIGEAVGQGAIHASQVGSISSSDATLSGNFVIEFARARMSQIDSSLTRQLQRLKDCQRDTGALNDVLTLVSQYSTGFDDADKKAELKKAFVDAANKLPENSPLREQLLEMGEGAGSLVDLGHDNLVSESEMSSLKTKLDTALKKVDAASQEEQLTINLRLGQRNEVMQLAATLIQSMNETVKGIIGRS